MADENLTEKPTEETNQIPANRTEAGRFVKGVSGNPSGRPKLPEEIKLMKDASLRKAIEILHLKIHDEKYIDALSASDLIKFIETAFDRFGLPKVTKQELTGGDGEPLLPPIINFQNNESANASQ